MGGSTQRKTARELAESKRRLEGIVDSAMDAIITVDEDQNIILFNPAAELMFGVRQEDALGQPIARFIPERYREAHEMHIHRFGDTGVTGRRMGALGAINGLRADGQEFPIEASISQVEVNGERLGTVILRDITERMANEEARLMLAREVDHRAKNALAVVQSLVSLTTAPTREAFVAAVRGRVSALARAHTLLAQNRWKGASLAQVIRDETEAYQRPGQIAMSGPGVMLQPNSVQPVSLIVHELATNAIKYGALSTPEGRITLDWEIRPDGSLELIWTESGGPPVVEPATRGFGSTLITAMGARQLSGKILVNWFPEGIEAHATLPADSFQAIRVDPPSDSGHVHWPSDDHAEGRLLLVEDEALVAIELSRALEDSGWEVVGPAATLEEAFRLVSANGTLDVAVLDVNLNGEMVYPLADELETRGVPFLFCSGYETIERADRYRYSPVVRKPTSFAILMSELRRILAGRTKIATLPAE
jgi:PAS domain S-box-containing protein